MTARVCAQVYDSEDGDGGGGMDDASTVASNDAAILLDDSSANFVGHTDAVYWSAFHPSNSSIVATASGDDTAGVWDSGTNALVLQLRGHTDTVNWVAYNAAGTMLATASLDATVKVWDPATGVLRHTLDGPSADILWATWHPRGNVILAGSEDCSAWMWNADDGTCMGVFSGHTSAVSCGGFTPDGRHVWSAGADASLRFWSPRTFACLLSLCGGTFVRDAITSAAAGMTYAVAGGDNGDLRIVFYRVDAPDAAATGKIAGSFTFDSSVETVAINSTETLVAAGLHNGSIVIVDCTRMLQRCVMQHRDSVTQVLFHPTTDYALFSSAAALDCSIRFWDCRCVSKHNIARNASVSASAQARHVPLHAARPPQPHPPVLAIARCKSHRVEW